MTNFLFTRSEDHITPKPGIYEGIPFSEYMRWNCFSKSMTGPALRSGLHLRHYIESSREGTYAMDLGSLVDCLLLEPQTFNEVFVVRPDTYTNEKDLVKPWSNNAKVCKQWNADNADRIILKSATIETAETMVNNIMNHAEAAAIIQDSKKQVSIVWEDEETGILCKGRPDIVHGDMIWDLKTTIDASPEQFTRTIGNGGYHIQAGIYSGAWYNATNTTTKFGFMVCESEKPHGVALYEMGNDSMIAGQLVFKRALAKVADYIENGLQGYSAFAEPIGAPRWMVDREIEMHEGTIEF